jgi:tRNA A37 threonylcarbamoyltransferase TsaD
MDNWSTLASKDFRSTFFPMKQGQTHSKEKSEEPQNDSVKKKILSKHKNYGSRNNLEKTEEEGIFPKIAANSNLSNIMDNYKKTLYGKKFSNDINFAAITGKRP